MQVVIAGFGGPYPHPGPVLDVEVDSVEPVRGREADEVLDELRPVRVVARRPPVVVACAADRDDRLDPEVRVHSRDPGRDVDVRDVAVVEAGPVLSRQVEQDQLVDVVPRQAHAGDGSPAEVLGHDDTTRRRCRWRGRARRRRSGLYVLGDGARCAGHGLTRARAVPGPDRDSQAGLQVARPQQVARRLRTGDLPAPLSPRVAAQPPVAVPPRAPRPAPMRGDQGSTNDRRPRDARSGTVLRRTADLGSARARAQQQPEQHKGGNGVAASGHGPPEARPSTQMLPRR